MELASLRQRPLLLGPLLLLNRGATTAGATRISPSMPCARQDGWLHLSMLSSYKVCFMHRRALHAALVLCGAMEESSVYNNIHVHTVWTPIAQL